MTSVNSVKTNWIFGELIYNYDHPILNHYLTFTFTFTSICFSSSTANNGAYEADVDYDDNMNDAYNNYMNDDAVNEAEAEEQQDEGNEEQKEENQQQDNGEQKEENQQQNQQNNGEQKDENKQQGNENQKGEEGGGRKLKQQIDCSRCNELQCFDKYADDDTVVNQAAIRDEIDTNIGAWIEEVANCKATNEVIDGQPVYIGPICSDYADTFEIGAFLDEDCSIYTKLASFGDIAIAEKANYNVDVVGYAINSLKTAFYEPMTCEAQDFAEVNTHFFHSHWCYNIYDTFTLTMSLLHCFW